MLCICPIKPRPGVEFGCGRCKACRINKRRMWTARLVLEAATHTGASAFVTLTYDPQHVPEGGSLVPGHVEEFRYQLRYLVGPFRYYFVGEYGEAKFRPHYHCLLFGVVPTDAAMKRCWEHGSFHVGMCSVDSAAYCAGYVTKKMTSKDDPRLSGRHPEFSRMSRKPGIGSAGLAGIISWLYTSQGAAYLQRFHDVPKVVRFGGKIYPLGRYLVGKLRAEFGIVTGEIDHVRGLRQEALRLEALLPEAIAAREFRREGHYQRAEFYLSLRRSKEKL